MRKFAWFREIDALQKVCPQPRHVYIVGANMGVNLCVQQTDTFKADIAESRSILYFKRDLDGRQFLHCQDDDVCVMPIAEGESDSWKKGSVPLS